MPQLLPNDNMSIFHTGYEYGNLGMSARPPVAMSKHCSERCKRFLILCCYTTTRKCFTRHFVYNVKLIILKDR